MPGRVILGDGGGVDDPVELAVASSVESVAFGSSAAGFEGGGSVGHGEFGFGGVAAGVADFGEDLGGGQVADAVDVGEVVPEVLTWVVVSLLRSRVMRARALGEEVWVGSL